MLAISVLRHNTLLLLMFKVHCSFSVVLSCSDLNKQHSSCSEKLFMQMADRMAADGYKDAGYTYVSIDVSGLNVHMKKKHIAIHVICS